MQGSWWQTRGSEADQPATVTPPPEAPVQAPSKGKVLRPSTFGSLKRVSQLFDSKWAPTPRMTPNSTLGGSQEDLFSGKQMPTVATTAPQVNGSLANGAMSPAGSLAPTTPPADENELAAQQSSEGVHPCSLQYTAPDGSSWHGCRAGRWMRLVHEGQKKLSPLCSCMSAHMCSSVMSDESVFGCSGCCCRTCLRLRNESLRQARCTVQRLIKLKETVLQAREAMASQAQGPGLVERCMLMPRRS